MSAYIELHVKGGGMALIDAGSIKGVMVGKGGSLTSPGTESSPIRVLLGAGDTVDAIGDFAGKILVRAHLARLEAKRRREAADGDPALEFYVDYLTPMGEDVDGSGG